MRIRGWVMVGVVVAGGALSAVHAQESQEARIRHLTQEALELRKAGKYEEATERLAQAERELARGKKQEAGTGKEPGAPDAARGNVDSAKEFADGLAAMSAGDLQLATRKFQNVVANDPQSFEAHNNLAVIYAEQGNEEQALAELRAALRLRPDYYRGRKNLAELYARLASRAFKDAAALAPDQDRPTLLERGRVLAALGHGELPAASAPPASVAVVEKREATVASQPEPAKVEPRKAADDTSKRPREFLALGETGSVGIVIEKDRLRLYQQEGDSIRATTDFLVKTGKRVPLGETLYVAAPAGKGITLVPVRSGGISLRLDSSSESSTSIGLDAKDLQAVTNAVKPYLTPVLITSGLDLVEPGEGANTRQAIETAFRTWQDSWATKDLDGYVSSYTADYDAGGEQGNGVWRKQREKIFSKSGDISIEQSKPAIVELDDSVVTLSEQRYRSTLQLSTGIKRLAWVPDSAAAWHIRSEGMLSEQIGSAAE